MPLFEKERSSPAELEARLRVHRLPEVGPKRFFRLMEAFGSASSALPLRHSAHRPAHGVRWACPVPAQRLGVTLWCVMAPALRWPGWSVRASIY